LGWSVFWFIPAEEITGKDKNSGEIQPFSNFIFAPHFGQDCTVLLTLALQPWHRI
jgi:hypothetical protein